MNSPQKCLCVFFYIYYRSSKLNLLYMKINLCVCVSVQLLFVHAWFIRLRRKFGELLWARPLSPKGRGWLSLYEKKIKSLVRFSWNVVLMLLNTTNATHVSAFLKIQFSRQFYSNFATPFLPIFFFTLKISSKKLTWGSGKNLTRSGSQKLKKKDKCFNSFI